MQLQPSSTFLLLLSCRQQCSLYFPDHRANGLLSSPVRALFDGLLTYCSLISVTPPSYSQHSLSLVIAVPYFKSVLIKLVSSLQHTPVFFQLPLLGNSPILEQIYHHSPLVLSPIRSCPTQTLWLRYSSHSPFIWPLSEFPNMPVPKQTRGLFCSQQPLKVITYHTLGFLTTFLNSPTLGTFLACSHFSSQMLFSFECWASFMMLVDGLSNQGCHGVIGIFSTHFLALQSLMNFTCFFKEYLLGYINLFPHVSKKEPECVLLWSLMQCHCLANFLSKPFV